MSTISRAAMLPLLAMLGCDLIHKGGATDTGDTADTAAASVLEARIQAWCTDETCNMVGFYGGASAGTITNYIWTVDGLEVATGATETSTTIDMSTEVGNMLTVELTIEDGSGSNAASMLVSNVGMETESEISAIIVMPPPSSCASSIPVISLGSCVTGIKGLHFQAFDHNVAQGAPVIRQNGTTDFEIANGGSLTTPGFASAAAWFLNTTQGVTLYNLNTTQYIIGAADFPPHVIDAVIGSSAPAGTVFTPHFTFWFTAGNEGTDVRFRHTLFNGEISNAVHQLVATCNAGNLSFNIDPSL